LTPFVAKASNWLKSGRTWCSQRIWNACRTGSSDEYWHCRWTENWNRGTASDPVTSAAALVTLFFISDEELCTDYWPDPHEGGACNCQAIINFGSVLYVGPGAKINSSRCENIGATAVFLVTRQNHLNNAAICASILREIRDLHEMIARHRDFENRIVAGDDLAFKRISEGNCCGSKKKRSDEKSHGERSHNLTNKRDLSFGH